MVLPSAAGLPNSGEGSQDCARIVMRARASSRCVVVVMVRRKGFIDHLCRPAHVELPRRLAFPGEATNRSSLTEDGIRNWCLFQLGMVMCAFGNGIILGSLRCQALLSQQEHVPGAKWWYLVAHVADLGPIASFPSAWLCWISWRTPHPDVSMRTTFRSTWHGDVCIR